MTGNIDGMELVVGVLNAAGLTKAFSRKVAKEILDQIREEAMAGQRVIFRGFGTFHRLHSGGFHRQGKDLRRTARLAFKPGRAARVELA